MQGHQESSLGAPQKVSSPGGVVHLKGNINSNMAHVSQTVTSQAKIPSRRIHLWTVPLDGEHHKFIFEPGGKRKIGHISLYQLEVQVPSHDPQWWCGLTAALAKCNLQQY